MRFTTSRVAAVLAAAFSIVASTNVGAVHPQPVDQPVKKFKPASTPLGLSRQEVTVVVQLAGASVAEQQGDAGRKLTDAEKRNAKAALRNQQEGVRSAIEGRGGRVVAH